MLQLSRRRLTAALVAGVAGLPLRDHGRGLAQEATPAAGNTPLYQQSPWWPYLSAHIDDPNPPDVLGDPVTVTVEQGDGKAFWILPAPRKLDPTIFGTADVPKGTELPPLALGIPPELREALPDGSQQTSVGTPASDKYAVTTGQVRMTLVDATAIDGATTKDQIDFDATFTAPDNQGTYRVVVTEPEPHGWYIPTGGGVVTNLILHGITGWGTRLMPTEFVYAAFWGIGDVSKDGELIAGRREVHVMLTEGLRKQPYDMVWDHEVNPNLRQLHLMVAPYTPQGEMDPLPTGFMLPNGKEQPYFHVMFPAFQVTTGPGADVS
jgi:hypothetical protein